MVGGKDGKSWETLRQNWAWERGGRKSRKSRGHCQRTDVRKEEGQRPWAREGFCVLAGWGWGFGFCCQLSLSSDCQLSSQRRVLKTSKSKGGAVDHQAGQATAGPGSKAEIWRLPLAAALPSGRVLILCSHVHGHAPTTLSLCPLVHLPSLLHLLSFTWLAQASSDVYPETWPQQDFLEWPF